MEQLLKQLRDKLDLFDRYTKGDEVDQLLVELENKAKYEGQRFFLITRNGTFRKKIKSVNGNTFEWESGWANLSELQPNKNDKSVVKFVLDQSK